MDACIDIGGTKVAVSLSSGSGNREALLARRAICDVAHRVDRLVRWPGGDEHMASVERTVRGIGFEVGLPRQRIAREI